MSNICHPMDCSMPGIHVLLYLTEFAQTLVHWVWMSSNHLILYCPFPLLPSTCPSIRVFSNASTLFESGGQSIGASASKSVLPMTIQDWFPLELTGLISLQSERLSRVFSNTTELVVLTEQSINSSAFFMVQLSHPYMTTGKTIAWQSDVSAF